MSTEKGIGIRPDWSHLGLWDATNDFWNPAATSNNPPEAQRPASDERMMRVGGSTSSAFTSPSSSPDLPHTSSAFDGLHLFGDVAAITSTATTTMGMMPPPPSPMMTTTTLPGRPEDQRPVAWVRAQQQQHFLKQMPHTPMLIEDMINLGIIGPQLALTTSLASMAQRPMASNSAPLSPNSVASNHGGWRASNKLMSRSTSPQTPNSASNSTSNNSNATVVVGATAATSSTSTTTGRPPPTGRTSNLRSIQVMPGMREMPIWLKTLRLHKYTTLFDNMSYEQMMSLCERDLENLNITPGARRKILQSIDNLKQRPTQLRTIEQGLQRGKQCVRCAICTTRSMLSSPLRRFEPPSPPSRRGSSTSSSGESKDDDDATLAVPFSMIPDENVPGMIFRIVAMLYMLVFPPGQAPRLGDVESEYVLMMFSIFDRITNSDSFTSSHQHQAHLMRKLARNYACPVELRKNRMGMPHTQQCERCHHTEAIVRDRMLELRDKRQKEASELGGNVNGFNVADEPHLQMPKVDQLEIFMSEPTGIENVDFAELNEKFAYIQRQQLIKQVQRERAQQVQQQQHALLLQHMAQRPPRHGRLPVDAQMTSSSRRSNVSTTTTSMTTPLDGQNSMLPRSTTHTSSLRMQQNQQQQERTTNKFGSRAPQRPVLLEQLPAGQCRPSMADPEELKQRSRSILPDPSLASIWRTTPEPTNVAVSRLPQYLSASSSSMASSSTNRKPPPPPSATTNPSMPLWPSAIYSSNDLVQLGTSRANFQTSCRDNLAMTSSMTGKNPMHYQQHEQELHQKHDQNQQRVPPTPWNFLSEAIGNNRRAFESSGFSSSGSESGSARSRSTSGATTSSTAPMTPSLPPSTPSSSSSPSAAAAAAAAAIVRGSHLDFPDFLNNDMDAYLDLALGLQYNI